MSKYFYHGLGFQENSLATMLKILKTGGIKCKRFLNYKNSDSCNGIDYVSVCKKESDDKYENGDINGFYTFVQNSFCFMISDRIDAIKTEMLVFDMYDREVVKSIASNSTIRYSDMFDEWQVKGYIPVSSIVGIGIPISDLEEYGTKQDFTKLKQVLAVAEALKLDIVDSSKPNFVEDYESKKAILEEKRVAIKVKL